MCEEDIKPDGACVPTKGNEGTAFSNLEGVWHSLLLGSQVCEAAAMLKKARAFAKFTSFRGSGGSEEATKH
jgi:hypothetical protein